jgi:glycerol kinase
LFVTVGLLFFFANFSWTEHNPLEIMDSIHACIGAVLSTSPSIDGSQVVSIGLTNQRETSIVWDVTTGIPLHNGIVWHDARTAELVAEMSARLPGGKEHFRSSCGLPLSTYFSATKIAWMMRNSHAVQQAVKEGRARAGTVDSWVIWNLTGGARAGAAAPAAHVTDVSNASRTMLMDLSSRQWNENTCREFGIPLSMLPSIRSSSEVYGHVFDGPLKGVPISGCVGDQQAAMLGQLCLQPGQVKNTYGTGMFMLLNTGTTPVASQHGLLTTVCYQLGPDARTVYALEGSVAVAGSGVQWLRDKMGIIKHASEMDSLASTERDAGDVVFVPAFSGLLSPHWRDDARGVIVGLTHASNKAHLARAVLNAAAFQTREVLEAMTADTQASGHPVALRSLQVDGGMCASNVLMQFQADQLRIPVVRPASLEATATGAAFCAGLAVGFWPGGTEELQTLAEKYRDVKTFRPNMDEPTRQKQFGQWKKAVQRTFGWVETTNNNISETAAAATQIKVAHTAQMRVHTRHAAAWAENTDVLQHCSQALLCVCMCALC